MQLITWLLEGTDNTLPTYVFLQNIYIRDKSAFSSWSDQASNRLECTRIGNEM